MTFPDGQPNPVPPPLASLGDVELIQRIADRRQDAIAELYDRYADLVLGVARKILGNTPDAEEVVQEAFVQVWLQADRYDRRRASPSTWLVMITRSRAIDLVRSRKVRTRAARAAGEEDSRDHASPEGTRAVLQDERRERVLEALAGLPEEQREVLELAFYRGWTQREIARETGIPLGTVKTRTLLAMKKLRALLQKEIRELL